MCATSHGLASAAGAELLLSGGNAVDAAIAAAFTLTVCEPAMSHLGGQGNMLVHLAATGETTALDFYACAPGAADPDIYEWIPSSTQGGYRFRTKDDRNTTGGASICIPGNICGWVTAHRRWGHLDLRRVVRPSVRAAREGVPLTRRIAHHIDECQDRLVRFPATAQVFLRPDGQPRRAGELLVQPQLADTIEAIAADGFEPFYDGAGAEAIVRATRAEGGVINRADLARYPDELLWVRQPDRVAFKGFTVEGATPSSSALLLHLLALLDGLDFSRYEPTSAEQTHLLVEAMKLAFAERQLHIGDHTHVNVPLAGLLNPEYAASRRALIREDRASTPGPGNPWPFQRSRPDPAKLTPTHPNGAGGDFCTTHHAHVDRWGNFVSLTQSLGDLFGSAVMVPTHGFVLNNAMKLFDPRPGRRAAGIAPFKRPLAPWPTLVGSENGALLALGSPSGTRIPNAIAQVLVNVIDHETCLQAAVELPRVHWSGTEFEAEGNLPKSTRDELTARGHKVQYRGVRSPWFGAVQAVGRDPVSGLCHGAADPRRDGAVAGIGLFDEPNDHPDGNTDAATSRPRSDGQNGNRTPAMQNRRDSRKATP